VPGDWPSSRGYAVGAVLNWLFFLGTVALLTWGHDRFPPWLQAALVGLLTLSVAAQFLVAYRSVAREDEFVRALTFKCGIAAIGVTLTVAVAWGLGQQFLNFPVVPMWVVYPFFWGAFGLVSPFIRSSRA
jgi:hypothetical protein